VWGKSGGRSRDERGHAGLADRLRRKLVVTPCFLRHCKRS
jgi:hypothetical protein